MLRTPPSLASLALCCLALAGLGAWTSRLDGAEPAAPEARQAGPSTRDWPMFGVDSARSDSSPAATGIDARAVASLRRQQVTLDGTVDASAIYLHGVQVKGATHDVFFVTTTYGKTIAIDADAGSVLWEYTPPGYQSWAGSYRITTATPAADPDRQSIYAASPDGHIQKLAVADGRASWTTAITDLPQREKIASALNVFGGHVIATTGGYIGDRPPYQGHVVVLDAASGKLLHAWNSLCSDRTGLLEPKSCQESGSAIWGRAGAVVEPGTGNLFVATGNGRWDGRTNWGDAVLELDPDSTRVLGNYTPEDTEQLSARDLDVGSTSPALLAPGFIVQGGKDGRLRVLSLDRIRGTSPHRGGEVQSVRTPSGGDLFTALAVRHEGGAAWLFAADNGGTAAWVFENGRLQQKWRNDNAGTSPVVAGGLVYVADPGGGLRVYDPDPGRQIAVLECGEGHWNSPIVVGGRIALPEGNSNAHRTGGILDIWRK